MSNLKPCPFCGKEPNQKGTELGDRPCFYYECDNPKCCAAEMGWHDTEQEAIDAWNNRPIEDALRKEISQLQADNISLVEQVNQMALKPNQELIEWHECSEGVPTDSGHYLILCEDGDVYIDWFNNGSDEAGNPEDHCPWGDPEWLIEVQDPGAYKVIAWAYMPKGNKDEELYLS